MTTRMQLDFLDVLFADEIVAFVYAGEFHPSDCIGYPFIPHLGITVVATKPLIVYKAIIQYLAQITVDQTVDPDDTRCSEAFRPVTRSAGQVLTIMRLSPTDDKPLE